MKKLIITGSGIKFLSHLSYETQSAVKSSDCVLFLVNEPAMKKWIEENSIYSKSLDSEYFSSVKRADSYKKIELEIENTMLEHELVCLIIYGHPTFFSSAAVNVIPKIRDSGVFVEVLPAISALDCLFADFEIDPAEQGFQSYEATSFLLHDQKFNSDSALILWQIGVIGNVNVIKKQEGKSPENIVFLRLLVKKLLSNYPRNHACYLYVASQYPRCSPVIQQILISDLENIEINRLSTLYIPASTNKSINNEVKKLLLNT